MEINRYFTNRHTNRNFAQTPVSDHDITEMLEAAVHAPNTGNMQWYSVVVTRDAGRRQALARHHFNQPASVTAPVLVTFCIDLFRFEKWCRARGAEPGFENLQSLVAAAIDTSLVAQQFCTVAEMAGYGTCYLGTTAYNAAAIARELSLPPRVMPLITVALGHRAAEAPRHREWRLPVEAVLHFEDYKAPADADIDSYWLSLEEMPQSKHFMEENHKDSLAAVFTDVRYPRESSEAFSASLLEYLRENKFI